MTQEASPHPLLAPIPGALPAGIDLAYDPDFDRLGAEVEKMSTLAGELPDWRLLAAEGDRLLREKSKDLRVMGWLVAARAHLEGWPGIASGLATYLALTDAYWDTLYPPRARAKARAGQVEWLCGVLARRITSLDAGVTDADTVRSLEPLVAELMTFFHAQLGELAPSTGPLRIAVRDKVRALPEAAPPPPPPAPLSEPAPPTDRHPAPVVAEPPPPPIPPVAVQPAPSRAPRPAPAPPPELAPVAIDASALADLDQSLDAARTLRAPLITLAHHARQVAPTSGWPYRTVRLAAWLAIDRLPESEQGKTFVRAPKDGEREELASRHAAGQWDAVRELAEEAAGMYPFWFDAHRYAALALDAKGADYREARSNVGREIVAFAQRLEGVERLTFSNGIPFAAPETLDWLAAERGRHGRAASGPAAAGGHSTDDDHAAFVDALDACLADTSADTALGDALAQALALPTARARFRARLAVARRARSAERTDLALVLYEQLLPEVDATLEAWEPTLAAEMLAGYLEQLRGRVRNVEGAAADEEARTRLQATLYRRLLTLDPHAAIRSGTPW